MVNHIIRGLNPFHGVLSRVAGQIGIRRFRHKRPNGFNLSVMDELADVRRTDGLALRLCAGDDGQLNARLGQNFGKRFVVQAGRVGERLFADVAPRQVERGRDAGKQRGVQLGVRVTISASFKKYEGNVADEIM